MKTKYSIITLVLLSTFLFVINKSLQETPKAKKSHFFEGVKQAKRYDNPDKAALWLAERRQAPKGENPAVLNGALKQAMDRSRQQKSGSSEQPPAFAFEDIGPGVFGGRIRAFAVHPDKQGVLLAGGVSGGIWKSTDDGKSWHSKDDFLPNMMIGSMVVDSDHSNRVFVGTGEGFFNADAGRGAGIYVSEDFGETWNVLPATVNDNFYYVNRLAKIPGTKVLLAATRKGLFRSVNLGQSWSEVSGVSTAGRGFVDLKSNPTDNQHLLAVHYGGSNDALTLKITAPASIAGDYEAAVASFGGEFTTSGISGEIVQVNDNSGVTDDGCQSISNISGKIALIQRGSCNFTLKVKNAQQAGAIAALVYQNKSDDIFAMGGEDDTITIPAAMISKADGEAIKAVSTVVSGNIVPVIKQPLGRFVMESTNGGETWEALENRGLPKLNVGRMELNFGNDGTTYVAVSNNDNKTLGLWRSAGKEQNFEKTASNTAFVERQGWYDLAVSVNPNNSNHVLVGAVDQYVTHDAGATINKSSFWQPGAGKIPQYIHADHHGYFFSPHNSNHIYVVSDGGVSKSEDNGETYFQLNNGLNISQSYGIAVSPDGKRLTSGTQDNGSQMYYGDSSDWFEWYGGDGGHSAWDQQQGQYVYGSYVEGQMYGSADRGVSVKAMKLPDRDGAAFIQPFVLDPLDGNRMMVGTDNVFLSNNARSLDQAQWTDVSDTLDGSSISALAFNPHDRTQAFVGTSSGNIYRITGLGSSNTVTNITPTTIDGSAYVGQVITDIKVSLYGSKRLYVTMGGYYANRLISTPYNSNNWRSESANLPDMPLYQISFDPKGDGQMFVGSELGLWSSANSSNGAGNWQQYTYGVAYTRVVDLVWHGVDTLFVGTHGRGTFKAVRQPIEVELERFIATNSNCDDDAYLDYGETGLLFVKVKNRSANIINNIQLRWLVPSELIATEAGQNIGNLGAFAEAVIAIEVSLPTGSACLNSLEIPIAIQHDEQSYEQAINLIAAANKPAPQATFDNEAGAEMTTELTLGNGAWKKVTDRVHSGSDAWFSANDATYADKSLISPWLTLKKGGNQLKFVLRYEMEADESQHYDGVVLEMRKKGGRWFDIGQHSSVPYDGHLYVNNPAKGRLAWSGSQPNWRAATIDLNEQYLGKTIQFRFRNLSDSNKAAPNGGFWVDGINMSNAYTAAPLSCDECISNSDNKRPYLGMWYDPAHDGHGFVIDSVGRENKYYTIFYTYDDDGNPEWYNSLEVLQNSVAEGAMNRVTWNHSNSEFNSSEVGRLSIDFDASHAANHPACQNETPRNLQQSALATWQIGSQQQTWCIQPVIAEKNKPAVDFGGLWWGGQAENGWGFSVFQSRNQLGTVIYYYDAIGNPRWAIGLQPTENFAAGKAVTIALKQVEGYGRLSPAQEVTNRDAGEVILTLNNRYIDLDIDGTANLSLDYLGAEGGNWNREQIAIAAQLTRFR